MIYFLVDIIPILVKKNQIIMLFKILILYKRRKKNVYIILRRVKNQAACKLL